MLADQANLHRHVHFLTSLTPPRHYLSGDSLEQAAGYCREAFHQVGAVPAEQTWTARGKPYRNILATYNPQEKKRLVVGAHYDVCGSQPGADDNASGVAGLLETARMLFTEKPALDYAVEFVAYCLEEPPFFATTGMGSYVHARSLDAAKAEVIGMICYEMIGYFSEAPDSQKFPDPALARLYPTTGNFIIVVGVEEHKAFNDKVYQSMKATPGLKVEVISFPPGSGREYASLSDQRNYWSFGYPALMINDTAFLRNPHYHQPTDTIDTLDFGKMAAVVNGVYAAVSGFGG